VSTPPLVGFSRTSPLGLFEQRASQHYGRDSAKLEIGKLRRVRWRTRQGLSLRVFLSLRGGKFIQPFTGERAEDAISQTQKSPLSRLRWRAFNR
ncbi:MAG: hypothetical protein ACREQV_24150, partial [Candidatus Binatia bacterium]